MQFPEKYNKRNPRYARLIRHRLRAKFKRTILTTRLFDQYSHVMRRIHSEIPE